MEVLTTYDSRYVLRRSNQIFSSEVPIQQSDIDCFVSELKSTGIFADVQVKITPSRRKDFHTLLINIRDVDRIDKFAIRDIVLSDVPEVDRASFQTALAKQGVTKNLLLVQFSFSQLEEKITQALREVYPRKTDKKVMGAAWVTISPDGMDGVKLTVSPAYLGCSYRAD